jgi:hypothetical protein
MEVMASELAARGGVARAELRQRNPVVVAEASHVVLLSSYVLSRSPCLAYAKTGISTSLIASIQENTLNVPPHIFPKPTKKSYN